jgi:hypothetical protein
VYDGDGRRVKTTFGSSTTSHPSSPLRAGVGDYFEWTGSTSTMVKYYYASGQRVALRKGSTTRYWLLTDHPSPSSGQALSTAFRTELVISGLAAITLYAAAQHALGWALALISIVHHALVHLLGETLLKKDPSFQI